MPIVPESDLMRSLSVNPICQLHPALDHGRLTIGKRRSGQSIPVPQERAIGQL
jgi:hypothetical protein